MGFLSILNRLPGASGTLAPIVLSGMIDGAGLARPGTFPNRLAAWALQNGRSPDVFLHPLRERAAVLSRWRLPRRCRGLVYEGLSKVNPFKVLFSCLTGEKPDLLPDKTFAHDPGRFGVVVRVPENVFADR